MSTYLDVVVVRAEKDFYLYERDSRVYFGTMFALRVVRHLMPDDHPLLVLAPE